MLTTKTRKCRAPGCANTFTPGQSFQTWCGPSCGAIIGAAKLAKAKRAAATVERREDKVRRQKVKTRGDWIKDAQTAFNAYIRARDADKPCICCGKPLKSHDSISGHNVDAGHYRSVGSAPHLRYDERNCHAQLVVCNRYGAGRAVDYRLGLIARIGLEAVEALEADQTPRRYTVEELQAIKKHYAALVRELKGKE